jgi:type II secretory pathway component PulF
MLFSSHLSLSTLIAWSRALRHGLDAGLSPVRVLRQQAKSGPSEARTLAADVADRLEKGTALEDAFREHRAKFPQLFHELIAVGEKSGRLSETFGELEEYFESVKDTRRTFFQLIRWPAIQYVAAILVITLMILVLGLIGSGMDPLGLGLTGPGGAVAFLIAMTIFTAVVVAAALFVAGHEPLRAKVEAVGLAIPGLGGCFRALALNRFSLAYYLTAEAGMRADQCLRSSLRATANSAYAREADAAAKAARRGQDVASVLGGYGPRLFPDEFMSAVDVGEESGRLAEVMKQQADYYRDEARRKMKVLAGVAAGAVYLAIGVLLIAVIFKIAMTAYIGPLNDAMNAADNPEQWMRGGR